MQACYCEDWKLGASGWLIMEPAFEMQGPTILTATKCVVAEMQPFLSLHNEDALNAWRYHTV